MYEHKRCVDFSSGLGFLPISAAQFILYAPIIKIFSNVGKFVVMRDACSAAY